jgi:hypothetical protein
VEDTWRECTVITKEPTELLSLRKKHFRRIFMLGGGLCILDSEQKKFLWWELTIRKNIFYCWYWWNWWPPLFKPSFSNNIKHASVTPQTSNHRHDNNRSRWNFFLNSSNRLNPTTILCLFHRLLLLSCLWFEVWGVTEACFILLLKEGLNSGGHQFHQYL